MRKRELQSISLKLSDLKEYEAMRLQRSGAEQKENNDSIAEETTKAEPIANVGTKSKKEVERRLNTTV